VSSWMSTTIEEIPAAGTVVGAGLLILAGLVYCLVGYRIFRFLLGLTGFLLAGPLLAAIVGWLSSGNALVMGIGLLVGGLAGAFALVFLYKAGVFCLGLLGGAVTVYNILYNRPEAWVPVAILGAGLAGGLLALGIERPVMSVATAVIGAWIAVNAFVIMLGAAGFEEFVEEAYHESRLLFGMLTAWAALGLIGAFVQLVVLRPQAKQHPRGA